MNTSGADILGYRKAIIDIPAEWRPAIDELPGDLRRIAEVLDKRIPDQGVRLTLLIAQEFPGQYVRFHNPKKFLDRWRNAMLRIEYDSGTSVRELTTLTGLSDRQVRDILNRPDKQGEVKEKQMKLF